MAPKTELFTAGTDDLQKKKAPLKPRTTREKIAAMEAKKANTKPAPLEPLEEKMPKKRVLPPLGEAFRITKSSPSKKSTKPGKPMTTKEKERTAAAAKKAKPGVQTDAQSKGGGKAGERVTKIKPLSTFGMLKVQDASVYKYASKNQKPSVLVRLTARSKRVRRELGIVSAQDGAKEAKSTDKAMEVDVFRLMDLPNELRLKIWNLVVVDEEYFIIPELSTGQEQPDLAMVSRSIRGEVLLEFYQNNVFAVDLSPVEPRRNQKTKPSLSGVPAISKWSTAIEAKGWFSEIRKWAFTYTAPSTTMLRSEEDGCVVFVAFEKSQEGFWKGCIEVHRDARCLLPAYEEFGMCVIQDSPAWLNKLVDEVMDRSRGKDMSGRRIVQLAEAIKTQAPELLEFRCCAGPTAFDDSRTSLKCALS